MRRNIFGIPLDIVWVAVATIKPRDVIENKVPLLFFDADARLIVAEVADRISLYIDIDKVVVPARLQNKTVYYVKDESVAYAIDLAQSFIIKGVRDYTYRALWILHALSYQEMDSNTVEIVIDSAIANSFPDTHMSRNEFIALLMSMLREYDISVTASNNLIKMRRKEVQEIPFIILDMALKAWNEIKYVRPLLKLLCMEIGPLRRSDAKQLLSQKLLYKPDSVRVKVIHPAKKYDYVKEVIAPNGEEILIPNCKKCIFYANEEMCRDNALEIIRDKNLKTKLSTKPTYILNTIAIYLQNLDMTSNSIAKTFTYINIGLQLIGEQDLAESVKMFTIKTLQNIVIQVSEIPNHT
jgi:hypothetical protein